MNDVSENQDWKSYKKVRKAFQVSLLLYIPLTILSIIVYKPLSSYFFILYALIVVVPIGYRHVLFPCPKCKKPIHFKNSASFLGKECSHCGQIINATLNV